MTIRAAQAGDRRALASIVDEFTPTVLGAAFGLSGNWDLAADIAQETFATMVLRLGDLREPTALPGWLMAVVRSTARQQRRSVVIDADESSAAGPEDIAIERDEAKRLRFAVEALPADLRLPMVLHYFAHLSLSEIALMCDLPLSTVKQRMRVARARLREGMDEMAEDVACRLRPDPGSDPSDVIRMYTAMRSGDIERVRAILTLRPDLVDVRENWTRAESFAHRLPWTTGGGTPILRAVERGDVSMVRVLLEQGADPNGSCTCEGGESPLWVAVVQNEVEIVDLLLKSGADPTSSAFGGRSALDIAMRRGYSAIAESLISAGATCCSQEVGDTTEVPAEATGIKTIDLWCPLPSSGLVHMTPGFGLGAYVLISELSYRAIRGGRRVVWTGFAPAPTDLGDLHHILAETDLADQVVVAVEDPTAPLVEQIRSLDRGITLAHDDAFLVVFSESGRLHAIEERLGLLSKRSGVTLVVAPLDGSVSPPRPQGSPYLAAIVFDLDRAKCRLWPALSSSSWSKVAGPELAELADRARSAMTDGLDEYLAQPFYVAEHVTGLAGESVDEKTLMSDVLALLEGTD